jgi:PP-loop superfamily ATP-utilizing enzyme
VIPLERALAQVFATLDQVAVAVSGGVDSMTLAHLTHRHHGARAHPARRAWWWSISITVLARPAPL